jgi:hypothetical protein
MSGYAEARVLRTRKERLANHITAQSQIAAIALTLSEWG